MITEINESKTLKTKYHDNVNVDLMNKNVIQSNGGMIINADVSAKSVIYAKKIFWNPATCNCKNLKYLASVMDDSVITCDRIIEEVVSTNFN